MTAFVSPLLLALLLAAPAPSPSAPAVVHADGRAYGLAVAIEVRGLPAEAARAAATAALAEIAVLERETEPGPPAGAVPLPGTLAALNAAAGRGAQALEPRLFRILSRAADFCVWSNGAHGPLGRDLYRLWGGHGAPAAARPADDRLADAVRAAACGGLVLDAKARTASLAAGGAAELWGLAEGAAVDRAVEVLQAKGVRNGLVGIGRVWHAFGPGPAGSGWTIPLPALAGMPAPIGEAQLRDQSLALVTADDRPLSIAGDVFSPLLDQRTGRPVEGMQAVAVRTVDAVDAEALASGLFILGTREGQLRVGALRPLPSVLWVLGSGAGAPLLVEYHWSATAPKKAEIEGGLRLALPKP